MEETIEQFIEKFDPFLKELNKYPEGIKVIYSEDGYKIMVDLKIFK